MPRTEGGRIGHPEAGAAAGRPARNHGWGKRTIDFRAQRAISKLLEPDIRGNDPDHGGSRAEELGGADTGLASVGVSLVTHVPIPDGHSEEELWQIFTAVGQSLQGAARFVFDITHGFRSLPATGVFSLAFYLHLLPASLHETDFMPCEHNVLLT